MSQTRHATEVEPAEDGIADEVPEESTKDDLGSAGDAGPESEEGSPTEDADGDDRDPEGVKSATEDPSDEGGEVDPEADGEGGAGGEEDELEGAAPSRLGPGQHRTDEELERELSALLFLAAEPLGLAKLVTLLERPNPARVRGALEALRERLANSGLPYEVRAIAGGYQLFTTPDMAEVVGRTGKVRKEERVSPAAMETLSVIAYRQPVAKAEIEAIRGVQAGPILRTLVDRGLVKVTGRAEVPGSPLLYGTTKRFLDTFGLMGLDDLPRDGELVRD